ncbi:acid phosphatase 1-like [Dioscorea cayenensis subsp. rotundata]|uniref:Acid phosphatase 1-like n=1 Tax=Dioscorea cayennensis subsp. rotundata TaxID=55577 RepID=A0AB40CXK4_DIOCR|nr:acid phosphatase 1-like [Dioscorea cayenensis subsp. rotundata]
MGTLNSLIFIILLISSASAQTLIQMFPNRPQRNGDDELFCDSWRLSVETNNAGMWNTIPAKCLKFVVEYVNGDRYASDSAVVAGYSLDFARTVPITGDGKDVWVFDIDETLLSNIPYYAAHGYGSEAFNETAFDEWVVEARAPALPASLQLYEELRGLGYQLVLLTGRAEFQRNATVDNLLFAGYHSWKRLYLREDSDIGKTAVAYKSEKRAELEAQGYRIHGSSGDQWSDLIGSPMASRSFKLPNPLYFIA